MDQHTHLYRRQFISGPRYVDNFSNWQRVNIDNHYFLTVHPDLHIAKVKWHSGTLILLGYILDPYNPEHNNFQIIESIADKIKNVDDLFTEILYMGGRYIIIAKINNDFRIFSDANGMRQVFYCRNGQNELWCGSEPSILANCFGFTIDQKIRDDLFNLSLFSKNTEYWYPGNSTLYNNIYHLTPNHFIDLNSADIKRFWPENRLRHYSFNAAIEKSIFFLQHLIEAANNRFDLALGLSAGYDSRIVLAASKNVKNDILYFTHTIRGKGSEISDIRIPSELCKNLQLRHVIITIPDKMDEHFKDIFNKNVTTARESKGLNVNGVYNFLKNEGNEYVLVSGNMSEISKRNARRLPRLPGFMINGSLLTLFAEMRGSSLAICKFGEWLDSFKSSDPCNGLNVLDMFYWEQRMAKWAAMTFSEMDIAFDNFSPFNCRELLSIMISLPLYYRSQPDYIFHNELMNRMWPETLHLPINPSGNRLAKCTRYLLFKMRIYDVLKYLYLISIRQNHY